MDFLRGRCVALAFENASNIADVAPQKLRCSPWLIKGTQEERRYRWMQGPTHTGATNTRALRYPAPATLRRQPAWRGWRVILLGKIPSDSMIARRDATSSPTSVSFP